MSLGPLMLNVEGLALTAEDRELLRHPVVGGVILFARNFQSSRQLIRLVDSIRNLREPKLLVAVDQEGGRVQRFRGCFTTLPAASKIGRLHADEPSHALELAHELGWLLASELRCCRIDFSFTPVLDLKRHREGAIGDRAFHEDPAVVVELATAEVRGLAEGGMVGVGKHFPGHGSVSLDSHHATPVDERVFEAVEQTDLLVFENMICHGLRAIMSAHIVFPRIDSTLVTCSARWLTEILRDRLKFDGVVFSDDLSMQGAGLAGDALGRSEAALNAGCDMILVCNDRSSAIEVVDRLKWIPDEASSNRLGQMRGTGDVTRAELFHEPRFATAQRALLEVAAAQEPD